MLEKRRSGILIHPSSLPSSFGIGDFGKESYQFIEKLHLAHQTLWQILPLCPVDSYGSPYQSVSAFAGETLLISPALLAADGLLDPQQVEAAQVVTTQTDYALARRIKAPLFDAAFRAFHARPLPEDFAPFCQREAFWLEDFAFYQAMKAHLGDNCTSWADFPAGVRTRRDADLLHWYEVLRMDIAKEIFLQYQFQKQWQALKQFSNARGVQIIGDMPLFLSYDSADVWANPDLFLLDPKGKPKKVAGVPPDYFSPTGQLWGNPLYDWRAHQKTNYHWWIQRMEKALQDVDILRLDHFRGFASYWAIPATAETATEGAWEKGPGMKFFRALRKHFPHLPIIAEDLGLLTDEVWQLRADTKFPGMRILQFAFGNDTNNLYLPHCYEPNTVAYTGTHDNDTTRGWYAGADERERDHYRRYTNASGETPAWDLIRLAMASSANTVILPLQDFLDLDTTYRMNTPGTTQGNWTFSFQWDMWGDDRTTGLAYLSTLFGRNKPDNG